MDDNLVHGIKISRSSPSVSHLLFADDCLIFFRAVKEEALAIKEVLDRFESISGLGINRGKSEFVCSPNTSPENRKDIEDILGIKRVESHGKYLGINIAVGRNKQALFRDVEEKIDKRLADWKLKLLSRAGKDILLKSVALAMPVYSMQVYKIPKTVIDRMSNHMISFFWNKGGKERGTHWINKRTLLTEKASGGLGLRDLSVFNDALLFKQVWRILSNPDSLVAVLLKSKYFPNSSLTEATGGSRPSLFWKSIMMIKNNFQPGIQWLNGDGDPRWIRESSGSYTVKSGYSFLVKHQATAAGCVGESSDMTPTNSFWRKLWKLNLPPRTRLHAWRSWHNGLPDADVLDRRCGIKSKACGWCGWKNDTALHIVRDCWVGRLVGAHFDIASDLYDIKGGSMADWIFACYSSLPTMAFRNLMCICWILWNSRNDFVHSGRLWQAEEIVHKARTVLNKGESMGFNSVVWQESVWSPESSSIKVLCDSSWKWNTVLGKWEAGWGVIVRDKETVTALNAGVIPDISSSEQAEGHALWEGLSLGVSLNLATTTFLSDSTSVIRTLVLGCGMLHQPHWLHPCLQILNSRPSWKVAWVPREHNCPADFISRKARRNLWTWSRTDAIPYDIAPFLPFDQGLVP